MKEQQPKEDKHYYKALIIDNLRCLRKKEPCYAFSKEQVLEIKMKMPHVKSREVDRGIFKLWR